MVIAVTEVMEHEYGLEAPCLGPEICLHRVSSFRRVLEGGDTHGLFGEAPPQAGPGQGGNLPLASGVSCLPRRAHRHGCAFYQDARAEQRGVENTAGRFGRNCSRPRAEDKALGFRSGAGAHASDGAGVEARRRAGRMGARRNRAGAVGPRGAGSYGVAPRIPEERLRRPPPAPTRGPLAPRDARGPAATGLA